ncbi:MAG: methyltransferase domain-containing protein, partial [Vicinamibacterales bacterium]
MRVVQLSSAVARKAAVAVAIILLTVDLFAQQDEREREKVERVADVLAALGARDGAHIADLGSADGFYTLRIAAAVGPSGRAYGIDIDEKSLGRLREHVKQRGVANLEVILGDAADPKLPVGALDAVLIRNTYHEMTEHRSVLKGVMNGLKPGGELVVIEGIHENVRNLSREQQVKEHEIAPEIVETEL